MSWKPKAKTLELIAAVESVLEDAERLGIKYTLRNVHYALVSANVIPNTVRAYKNLSATLDKARWEGYLPLDALDDLTRRPSALGSWESAEDLLRDAPDWYRSDWWVNADPLIELWAEKDAVSSTVMPVAHEYGVGFLACRGFSSLTALAASTRRWDGRNVVLLYLGDHDPSGLDMDRDLLERLQRLVVVQELAVDVELRRVALTTEQIDAYQLPPQPTKEKDSRARGYSAAHNGSWELSALPPEQLIGLVRAAIRDNLPHDFDDRQAYDVEERRRGRELVRRVLGHRGRWTG